MAVFAASPLETIKGNLGMVGNSCSIREAFDEACTIADALKLPVRFPFTGNNIEVKPESDSNYLMGRWAQKIGVTDSPVYNMAEYVSAVGDSIKPISSRGESIEDAIKLACSEAIATRTAVAVNCGDWVFLACVGQSPEYIQGHLDERLSPETGPIQKAA